MKYKTFPGPNFYPFPILTCPNFQPSPPSIAKLTSLHVFSRGQSPPPPPPHKNGPITLWLASHMMTLKSPPTYMLFQVP